MRQTIPHVNVFLGRTAGAVFPFKYTLVNIRGVKPYGRLPETVQSRYFFLFINLDGFQKLDFTLLGKKKL